MCFSLFIVVWISLNTKSERTTSNARHAIGDGDGGKARAMIERFISNARHAIADGDGGEFRAIIERILSNARHTIGDGDGGKARAIIERRTSNARYGVLNIFVRNFFWYYNIASVFIRITGYFCFLNL